MGIKAELQVMGYHAPDKLTSRTHRLRGIVQWRGGNRAHHARCQAHLHW